MPAICSVLRQLSRLKIRLLAGARRPTRGRLVSPTADVQVACAAQARGLDRCRPVAAFQFGQLGLGRHFAQRRPKGRRTYNTRTDASNAAQRHMG